MGGHWHLSLDHVIVTTLSVLVVMQLIRIGAGFAVQRGGAIGQVGQAAGALVSFPAQ